ncbi:class I SAM-dependent methyltransferase [Nodosilinea sp. LEGE 07088]|uniref:class I SAM-dependent methyltransferase n=1 Tax=Nodosilinea sp. LEGE 07088 TaxID=2777968 RepID=UPI00187F7770|nr:class I SAM-dependent methyltransferase [Nodosilinea sp. LEGE 07088]MBE9141370.1 class I SAM-dependent methyltransferase [Nodosilinea sp. LEGE 07088]
MPFPLSGPLSDAAIVTRLTTYGRQDSAYAQFTSLVGANQYRRLYRLCDRYLRPGGRVLDWGCGNGHFSYYLVHKGYQACGFAFETFALLPELMAQGFGFQQGSLEEPVRLPYADGQFDAVVSVGVLEHVREGQGDELSSLREIYRILKPQGRFLCYHLPNRYSWIEWLSTRLPNKYHHQYRYTRPDIEALCAQAQLTLLEVKRYGWLPRNIVGQWPVVGHQPLVATAWDNCDRVLGTVLPQLCQNYCFVAQKP